MDFNKVTVLKSEQVYKYNLVDGILNGMSKIGKRLKMFEKNVSYAHPTDLAVILGLDDSSDGGYVLADDIQRDKDNRNKKLFTCINQGKTDIDYWYADDSEALGIRPCVYCDPDEFRDYLRTGAGNLTERNGVQLVTYGEYPQNAVNWKMRNYLDDKLKNNLLFKTGRSFTFFRGNRVYNHYDEFIDLDTGKRYIHIAADFAYRNTRYFSGDCYNNGEIIWVEVEPLQWYVEMTSKEVILVSEKVVAAGVPNPFEEMKFKNTLMTTFLDDMFSKDFVRPVHSLDYYKEKAAEEAKKPAKKKTQTQEKEKKEPKQPRKKVYKLKGANPYNFCIMKQTQEKTIEDIMKSDIAVFLHGKSSDGKSARVKKLDPDCEIIYLRNASPESLNGKSVYNSQTGTMEDIKPTWLVDLEERCQKEPDKLHVLFLDEITNALPSIQGIAFNIVLDREVNGKWKLPENVRIVAAGNEVEDSLAANPIAEPLFNRFAHIFIKTSYEGWLKWAAETNIHPAIYAYIAYKKGDVLRSKYDGEKPNADPRKWEMASKMLYATRNPESLRALVGEDITDEFIEFCKGQLLTLDDVLNDRYDDNLIAELDTGERYATIIGLTQVDEENVEKVIKFTKLLGAEMEALFEQMWAGNDEERLEIIAGIKMDNGGFSL